MSITIAQRYELHELLGAGGMGQVHRAYDRLTDQFIALKQVLVKPGQLRFAAQDSAKDPRIMLAHEFKTMASLRHPNIVSVLDYGFDQGGQPFFTMPLVHDAQTIVKAAESVDMAARYELIMQLLQALAYLHRHGIVHRDLKPGNVLVEGGETVRVLDFGLAIKDSTAHRVSGTLPYMAPEVLLGEPASPTSDMFAVGIIASEMLMGHHPFARSTVNDMISAILNEVPSLDTLPGLGGPEKPLFVDLDDEPTVIVADLPAIERPTATPRPSPADSALTSLMYRLLAKAPDERFSDATEVMNAFRFIMGDTVILETQAIRESYIQAARFVGREAQLEHLTEALKGALTGSGSAWLVGGETGVGKSRLLDELRTLALVEGASVWRGQGVAGGGLRYQLWREVIRQLVLSVEVSDLEASILKEAAPDMDRLIGQPIETAPRLEGDAQRLRLATTLSDIFRRLEKPVVLILEDLHWARESLDPIRQLARFVQDLPLLVVGSYRSDERPDLPQDLPNMHDLKLPRLEHGQLSSLISSMIGPAGENPAVVDLIEKETEGNVFFVVEVVRALAEEAGQLSDIGRKDLPETILAGGIANLIRRRLGQAPAWGQLMLQVAAVAGRYLDLDILRPLSRVYLPMHNLDEWLQACNEAAVLEVHEARWRFYYDRLRDVLLQHVDTAPMHQTVAETIERVYPDDDAFNEILMTHWRGAGVAERELHYLVPVAEHMLHIDAEYERARAMLEAGLALAQDSGLEDDEFEMLRLLGLSSEFQGDYEDAMVHYQQALYVAETTANAQQLADSYLRLGMINYRQGDYDTAHALLQDSIARYQGLADPAGEASALANLGALAATQGQFAAALAYYQQCIALAETEGDLLKQTTILGDMGVAAALSGQTDLAEAYFERSLELSRRLGDKQGLAMGLNNLGVLKRMAGDFEAALQHCAESLQISQATDTTLTLLSALHTMALCTIDLGQLTTAARYIREGLVKAEESGAIPSITYFGSAAARLLCERNQPAQAAYWYSILKAHPAATYEVLQELDRLTDDVSAYLPQEVPHLDTEALVAGLLTAIEG